MKEKNTYTNWCSNTHHLLDPHIRFRTRMVYLNYITCLRYTFWSGTLDMTHRKSSLKSSVPGCVGVAIVASFADGASSRSRPGVITLAAHCWAYVRGARAIVASGTVHTGACLCLPFCVLIECSTKIQRTKSIRTQLKTETQQNKGEDRGKKHESLKIVACNNNHIQRCNLKFFLQSPHCAANHLQHVAWRNPVEIMCNTSSAYHVQHVMLCAMWHEGKAQLLSLTKLISHLFEPILLAKPLNR